MDKSLYPSASRLHLLILLIVCIGVKNTGGGFDEVNKMAAATKCAMDDGMGSQTMIWQISVDSDARSYIKMEIVRLRNLAPQDKTDKLLYKVRHGWHLLFLVVVCSSVRKRVGDRSMILDMIAPRASCTCDDVAAFQTYDICQNSEDNECCDIRHLFRQRLIHEHHFRNYSDYRREHICPIEILLCLTMHVILRYVLKNKGKLRASNIPISEMSIEPQRRFYVSHKSCDFCCCKKKGVTSCGLNRENNEFSSLTISSLKHWPSVSNIPLCNVFCCTDHNKKRNKQCIMSSLFDIHAPYVHLQQVWVYPLIENVKTYLSRVQEGLSIPRDEEMCYEVRRLGSYSNTPVRASPMRLAQSGFYATGSGDETRCYSCRMTHSDWRTMDQPDQIHRSVSPDCPHLNRKDERNVPMRSESNDTTGVFGVTGECHGIALPEVTTVTPIVSQSVVVAPTSSEGLTPSNLPGLDISKAVYPHYRDLSRRLASYQGWGSSHVQDHQVLAKAGFYYAGYRDCVRCFYCGVGLRTWEREDDPWVEHVRWRSSCDYVRLVRGEQFVIQALANGLSVASSPFPPTAQNQTQNTVVTVKADGADATVKAEEMGFQRHLIERAVLELTTSQNISRGSVPLETLLEKLLVLNDPQTSASSISPSLNNNSTTFTPPLEQSTIPPSTKQQLSNEHQRTASATVTSSVRASADDSMSASITRQKAVGVVQQGTNTNADKTDQESNTGGVEKETEGLSDNQERQLEEENQSLRDESTCKICLDNPSCIVFLPCGHLVTCAECAPALRKCPICRALIRGTVRAHTVSSEDMQM